MIEIEGLTVRRGETAALTEVTCQVPEGGITAIIGPNGAGKSTLLHAIAGLIRPDEGHIRVSGTDVARARERDRAMLLSLLTQSAGAVPRLSVRELVAFGRWPHHRGRPTAEDARLTDAAIERFDLEPLAGREVEALSGGQRQRAFLAMAYVQDTPWMLLDEPLAALDPKYTRDIMDRLRSIADDRTTRRSVVIVLHDLSIAARHSDWCVALKSGRLHGAGPASETMTSGTLTALYDTPLRIANAGKSIVVVDGD
ncbi:ATP-binding cassette domain-containing protein [uncultured Maritimibacter sp.]|uniref:ATP-binding cassette domain-containing protein n=1 Tax=uncultured Maritimibacter sp. TaxID=991866 RepID=UPI000AF01ED3|nr:ATP-binding cassette domain-containing protein [uncultured Maritimibacter sp.]